MVQGSRRVARNESQFSAHGVVDYLMVRLFKFILMKVTNKKNLMVWLGVCDYDEPMSLSLKCVVDLL